MNTDMQSMISSYIEDELNEKDKALFENYMSKNIEFKKEVNSIKNMINQLNDSPNLSPSDHFLDNLHFEISKLSNSNSLGNDYEISDQTPSYWFSANFKTTLGFSFVILFISMFFINRTLISQDSNYNTATSSNLEETNILLSKTDTLETNKEDFPILQVKGSSDNK